VDETLIINSRLKTGFLGFLSGIEALQLLFEDLVVNGPLTFVLTHKISQDHIELFFAAVRSGLGANNNPSCKQFSSIVKRLLVVNNITSHTGNAKNLDSTTLLTVTTAKHVLDMFSFRRSENPKPNKETFDENVDQLAGLLSSLSQYKKAVIVYISGYVVKMVQKKINCEECLEALSVFLPPSDVNHQLIKRKAWGRLTFASEDVENVCFETENLLQKLLTQTQGKIQNAKYFDQKITTSVVKKLFSKSC
jgi:hypothetical protein